MHWKCPECNAINKRKKNSSETCVCGFVPYNSSEFETKSPVYVVKIRTKYNIDAVALQLHKDTDSNIADTKNRLAAGTTFNASFDNEVAAKQFADKYVRFNCVIQIEKEPTSSNASTAQHSISKLLVCPHCEESISADVFLCPYCAEPIGGKGAVTVQPSTPSGGAAAVRETDCKPTIPASPGSDERLKNKMARLNDLLAAGFVTQKEYDDKKQQLLNEYLDA